MSDSDVPEVSRRFELPQSALSLLQDATAAAARVASQQSSSVSRAAELLDATAVQQGIVWVCGDAADEHQRRLEAAGYSAVCMVDPTRRPRNVRAADSFFISAVEEVPSHLLQEARMQGAQTILLCASASTPREVADAVITIDSSNGQVIELAHAFVTMALCSQIAVWQAGEGDESAA